MIKSILQQNQFVSSSELCTLIQASESTIRRDLEAMEEAGEVERVHGGAILTKHMSNEPLYVQSRTSNQEEKLRIARHACSMIGSGDVVFLNHGTTVALIAQELAKRTDLDTITIITSNFGAALNLIETNVRLVVLGGTFRKNSYSLTGSTTMDNIQRYNANKAFFGVDGINVRYGCTFSAEPDAEVSRTMARQTHGQIHIVADHNKWGTVCEFNGIPFDRISSLITGEQLNEEISSVFADAGIELYRV